MELMKKPDIIVITGDLIDSSNTNIEVSLDLVKGLLKLHPVILLLEITRHGSIMMIIKYLKWINRIWSSYSRDSGFVI